MYVCIMPFYIIYIDRLLDGLLRRSLCYIFRNSTKNV